MTEELAKLLDEINPLNIGFDECEISDWEDYINEEMEDDDFMVSQGSSNDPYVRTYVSYDSGFREQRAREHFRENDNATKWLYILRNLKEELK